MRRLCIIMFFGVTEMKKIISLLIIAATLFSFAACTDPKLKGKVDPNITQGDIDSKQQSVIDTFGVSVDDTWIIGYKRENEYLEYIVVKYENGKKSAEATHRFYANESYYGNAVLEMGANNPAAIKDEEKLYIKVASNVANTGSYKTDFEAVDAIYNVKTKTGVQ